MNDSIGYGKKQIVGMMIMGLAAMTSLGCSKDSDGAASAGSATPAAAANGCGKDAADPDKQFCITLPAGYTMSPTVDRSGAPLYSEMVTFKGPTPEDGMSVVVGFSGSDFKTFDEELASDERTYNKLSKSITSGSLPGNSGKWWTFDQGGEHVANATAKAANGKAAMCRPTNTQPTPTALEACKTLRTYPGK